MIILIQKTYFYQNVSKKKKHDRIVVFDSLFYVYYTIYVVHTSKEIQLDQI